MFDLLNIPIALTFQILVKGAPFTTEIYMWKIFHGKHPEETAPSVSKWNMINDDSLMGSALQRLKTLNYFCLTYGLTYSQSLYPWPLWALFTSHLRNDHFVVPSQQGREHF